MDAPAFRRLLALETDIFEIAGVPKGVEIAFKPRRVIDIAGMGEDARLYGIGWDAAVSMNHDLSDEILLGPAAWTKQHQQHGQETGDWTTGLGAKPMRRKES